ncbi:MAG: mannose-1-phosphate guanylyltransferase [Desulfuromonadaceae bacterium]|nr:mannose-1-phosphate guanylyltransferase [Desulfuromonadaceae bacterium]MDD2849704.1 mannose-1-phosphate guanylyltransferase [Desulfuromonadaceae bacterium]MDD4129807.1 mannose-1-phosphate guanylyltransferase [Desulfuromonadaceae bacterium]
MYIVILAGGSGTRFWPLSRAARPKQLISITGDRSMLQRTVERVLPLKPQRILIITNHLQADETGRQMVGFDSVPIEVIAEPAARNTAPAIGLAAARIAALDPSGIMVVLPADHFIKNEKKLRDTLVFAGQAAQNRFLVTLGILPSRPETGYGYIEAALDAHYDGNAQACEQGPFPVERFVEKPPLTEAVRYLEEGNFFWNSGMFIWRADTILEEMAMFMPALHGKLQQLMSTAAGWEQAIPREQIAALYQDIENVSIDYGVMEKSSRVQMVPVEMGWSDVGSWSALPEVVEPDRDGTVCINAAGHVAVDSTGCLIYADGRMVATVGVHNVVIVSTPDAILVCDRERCQDVKKVVEQLGAGGMTSYL